MNRNALVAVLIVMMCGNAWAASFTPVPVSKNIYAFIGDTGMRTYENEGMNANAGFIVTPAGVVVVDSGSSYRVAAAMHAAIKKVSSAPVRFVINTGGQDHRWLGNGYFKRIGAKIIASRRARADMEERGDMEMAALRETLRDKFAGTQAVYPEQLVDKEETLRLGGMEIRVLYFGGGHTPGDSVVWLPQSRTLFAGDLIFVDRLLGVLPFSNSKDWLASFDAIGQLDPQVIVPGHGKVCDLTLARRETRDYLQLLRSHMQQAIGQGQYLQTAIDTLDQGEFAYLKNYELLRGVNASRVYVEVEAE